MSAGLWIQYAIISVVLVVCVIAVLRKLAPQLSSRWLAAASIRYSRPGRAAWVRAIGRKLQPKQATGNCSDGCSTCGACGPKSPVAAKTRSMPLEFKVRSK